MYKHYLDVDVQGIVHECSLSKVCAVQIKQRNSLWCSPAFESESRFNIQMYTNGHGNISDVKQKVQVVVQ